MPFKYASMQERIIANSVHSTTSAYAGSWCWDWVAKVKRNRAGTAYPVVSVREGTKVRAKLAHRVAVAEWYGEVVPSGVVVQHLCNNTLCVNPAHLAAGTQRENMRQMVHDGRDWYTKFVESTAVDELHLQPEDVL